MLVLHLQLFSQQQTWRNYWEYRYRCITVAYKQLCPKKILKIENEKKIENYEVKKTKLE